MNILRHVAVVGIMVCIIAATYFGSRNHPTSGYQDVSLSSEVSNTHTGEK